METIDIHFTVPVWEEDSCGELSNGSRIATVHAEMLYEGAFSGDGVARYVLYYDGPSRGVCEGYERCTGQLGDKYGSFVLKTFGRFQDRISTVSMSIVEGSGTEDFVGISGDMQYSSPNGEEYHAEFNYAFDE